jgi:hypothetical protein
MGKFAAGLLVGLLATLAGAGWYFSQLRSENAELRGRLAAIEERAQPQAAPAAPRRQRAAPRDVPPGAARAVSEVERGAMLDALRAEAGSVWFVSNPGDAEAQTYQRAIQDIFEQAGWQVRSSAPATFGLRPGIFFLMADDDPPSYVLTALGAFEAADIEVSAGRGYRQFNEDKKKENPNWRGFDMTEDQTFIVAVGPAPRPATPAEP